MAPEWAGAEAGVAAGVVDMEEDLVGEGLEVMARGLSLSAISTSNN